LRSGMSSRQQKSETARSGCWRSTRRPYRPRLKYRCPLGYRSACSAEILDTQSLPRRLPVGPPSNTQMQPTCRRTPNSVRALIAYGAQRNVGWCGRQHDGLQLICKSLGCCDQIPVSHLGLGGTPCER
jgi:hypothetical protein